MIRSPVVAGRNRAPRRPRPWRAGLFAPLLLLAACGPAADPEIRFALSAPPRAVAEASPPARFTNSEFIAPDGARLPLRKWLPGGDVKAVILALHGFGDYSNAFAMPAALWAERGIATYAYDQRGFGGAPGRGLWAGEGQLAADAVTASRLLRLAYPGRPLYLLGESMGGAVAILAATGSGRPVGAGPSVARPRRGHPQRSGGMGPRDDGSPAEARALRRGAPLSGHDRDRTRAAHPGLRQSADAEGAGAGPAGAEGSPARHGLRPR